LTKRELDKIINNNINLVKSVAKNLMKHRAYGMEYKDLVGYGVIGLYDAASKYSSAKGASFQTYARSRIRGAILDGIRKNSYHTRYQKPEIISMSKINL
jgi:RNA polymerase sigma factor for flagellar operon FliA